MLAGYLVWLVCHAQWPFARLSLRQLAIAGVAALGPTGEAFEATRAAVPLISPLPTNNDNAKLTPTGLEDQPVAVRAGAWITRRGHTIEMRTSEEHFVVFGRVKDPYCMPGAVGLDWPGFAISTRLISLSILPSPDDVTSFILRWLFGQGVIVALILSIKALYGWYSLAKGAAAATRKFAPTIKVTRDQLHAVRLYGLVLPVIVLSLIGTIIWIWGIATLIHKQIATGGAYSSAPYGLFALLLGVIGISILWAVAVSAINGSGGGTDISPAGGIVPAIVLAVIVAVVISIHDRQRAAKWPSMGSFSRPSSLAQRRL